MPANATFSPRQYHLMMLSFPILILAIIVHRMWPSSLNQSLASDGLKLPDGLGLNLSDCKPIIFPATIPADYTLALTYNGPTSYNCLDNKDSESCKADFQRFEKFASNKASGNRQKLEKARLVAKHKYLSEVEQFTSQLSSKQLKRHNGFIQELSLRLKEFIVAEMALNLGLGNCAEFTAIQIAIRLAHPENMNYALQRITVRFGPDNHVFLQTENTICDAYNKQHGPIPELGKTFVMYRPKLKKPATREVISIPVRLASPSDLSETLYKIATELDKSAQKRFINAVIQRFNISLNENGKKQVLQQFPAYELN